uniref:Uncharacterized protein n=1 Tax=Arundo donax TaxID=35708 RepID=A0A0A9FUQ2_ARUDO
MKQREHCEIQAPRSPFPLVSQRRRKKRAGGRGKALANRKGGAAEIETGVSLSLSLSRG